MGGHVNQEQRSQQTRSKILEAAQIGFARLGYDATSVAQICRLAGVSKGAFYYHFPTKQALFIELMENWLTNLDAQLDAIRSRADTVPQALMEMADTVGHVFRAGKGQLPVFLEFWSKAAREPEIWQALSTPYSRYQAFLCQLIEAGIAEGSLRRVDAEGVAQLLVSTSVGLVLQGLVDHEQADWGAVTVQTVRLILDAIERKD